jgi:hypothetical protein
MKRFLTLLIVLILAIFTFCSNVNAQQWSANGICDFVDGQKYSNGNTTGCACTWYSIDILSGDTTLNCAFGNCGQSYLEECAFDCNGHGGAPTLSVARTCDATAVPVCWFQGGGSAGELFCGTIALPIELYQFWGSVVDSHNEIQWVTSSEIDNDYFELYHSIDGITFTLLTEMQGAGNSTTTSNYRFLHFNPKRGVNYYRLTQVDFNGDRTEYTSIAITNKSDNDNNLFSNIFPNPNKSIFYFNYNGNRFNQPINVKIMDWAGRVVLIGSIDKFNNTQGITLDIGNIDSGVYTVIISQGNISEQKKIFNL